MSCKSKKWVGKYRFSMAVSINNIVSILAMIAMVMGGIGLWQVSLATAEVSVPDAPTNLATSTVSQTSVGLRWGNPDDSTITGYEYSTDNVSWTDISGSDATTISYIFSGLDSATDYTLYIRAVNSNGNSGVASIEVTTLEVVPSTPTGLATSSITHNTVAVSWTDPSNDTITGYEYATKHTLSLIHISEPTRPY